MLCQHNTMSSGQRVSPSSPVVTGPSVSEPLGPCRVSAHPAPAADLDLKSSSSHSDHSSETSLPEIQKEKYLKECSLLKPQTKDGQRPEWTFYPRLSGNIHTYHVGKQCFFQGVFLGNRRSLAERTVDKCLGRKKCDIDPRNGIPTLTPGDNPYMYPEQSKDFYKVGATLPPVNFSLVPYEKKLDTFIPLEPLPPIPNLPFWVKEKASLLKNEIREVKELDSWQSSIPLIQSLYSAVAISTLATDLFPGVMDSFGGSSGIPLVVTGETGPLFRASVLRCQVAVALVRRDSHYLWADYELGIESQPAIQQELRQSELAKVDSRGLWNDSSSSYSEN